MKMAVDIRISGMLVLALSELVYVGASLLYSEMEKLNGSCYPLDSCYPTRNFSQDHLWGDHICECGPHCILQRTCCADSPQLGVKLYLPQPENVKCQKTETGSTTVKMVSQCSDAWDWKAEVKEKCENGEHLTKDSINMVIPLTNIITQTTYKNYFCAVCNYGGDNFLFWNIALKSQNGDTIQHLSKLPTKMLLNSFLYRDNRKSWGVIDKVSEKFFSVKVEYAIPSYLRMYVKRCSENTIETCKSSYAGSEFESKCSSYYSPVEFRTDDSQSLVYRNVHCALCNDVNPEGIVKSSCKLKDGARKEKGRKRPVSFTLLVDFNRSDGDLVGITKLPEPDCGAEAVWDPYIKICRKLECPLPGWKRKDGRCYDGNKN